MLTKKPIHWPNTLFLGTTFLLSITAAPAYLYRFGCPPWLFVLFLFFVLSTGISITLGYHRLFSHITFKAAAPVKWFTLLFGAAAFEGSAMAWSADHRRHHKFVDQDEDPYDISKGFFHAHIGWLIFRHGPDTPLTWVRDLQNEPPVAWQHKHYLPIAFFMGFILPTAIGALLGGAVGALGAFLLAGVARTFLVHHMTFFINSLCHWIGARPYAGTCTARDSFLMALFTFGEGYHNFHHTFQYDYRNGVKPWQWDPTKWCIWILHRIGLIWALRTVPEERIVKAQIAEQERKWNARMEERPHPLSESILQQLAEAKSHLDSSLKRWEPVVEEYRAAMEKRGELSRQQFRQLQKNYRAASAELRSAFDAWLQETRRISASLCPA